MCKGGRACMLELCVQKSGIEPRSCRKEQTLLDPSERSCSVSTKFAQSPSSFTPRTLNRVPTHDTTHHISLSITATACIATNCTSTLYLWPYD